MTERKKSKESSDFDDSLNTTSSKKNSKCSTFKCTNCECDYKNGEYKLLCNKCWKMNQKINTSVIPENVEDIQSIILRMNLDLKEMENHSEIHNIDSIFKKFTNKLSKFRNKLDELGSKYEQAKMKNKTEKIKQLYIEILELYTGLISSSLMENYKTHLKQIVNSKSPIKGKVFGKNEREGYDDQQEELKYIYPSGSKAKYNQFIDRDIFFEDIKRMYSKPSCPNKDFDLYLDLCEDSHDHLIRYASFIQLPDILCVHLNRPLDKDLALLKFLLNSAPCSLESFSFNFNDHEWININYYIDGIEKWCEVTKKDIFINLCLYSKSNFERIVKASCNTLRLHIRNSRIQLYDEYDFSGPEYKTTYLSFAYCGDHSDDDWTNNPSRFENIILSISKCGLKESLQVININNTGITKDIAESYLEKYDMSNITIEETNPRPLNSFLY